MTHNTAESATAGVPVVTLQWSDMSREGTRFRSFGGLVSYTISRITQDGVQYFRWAREGMAWSAVFFDAESCKAAAQAAYEHLILSAINPDFLSELDTARAEIERLNERLNTAYRVKAKCNDDANFERKRAITAESALTAAQARIAELEGALSKIDHEYETEYAGRSYTRCTCCHVALSDGHPHLADCAWATLSPAVKEPK